jgi:hypothetical protein
MATGPDDVAEHVVLRVARDDAPLRNTVHDAIAAARRAGQQMHLGLPVERRVRPPDTS